MRPRKPLPEQAEPSPVERRPKTKVQESTVGTGHSGGAQVGGMIGSGDGVSREISTRGEENPTIDTSGINREVGEASGEDGGSDSSIDLRDIITRGERSGAAGRDALTNSLGQGDGSLKNGLPAPSKKEKIRKLQRTLYRKAKAEPKYRFYSLYGEISRGDVLAEAFTQVKANGGSGGVDGVTVKEIAKDEETRMQWLEELREELNAKRYKPSAVRRVLIPKNNGKTRGLGIPTIKDRVVQTAAVIVLGAIFEADFHPRSYGFRPRRNAHQAIEEIKEGLYSGRMEVIDADLSAYFDTIPHRQLMRLVAKRISDGSVLSLIKAWLRAPIEEEDEKGIKRRRVNRQGTPQGGVISPMLSNLYLNDLDHGVNEGTGGQTRMVRFADDFVILCPTGKSEAILRRLSGWLGRRGIRLNEEKSRVVNSRQEGFNFLGFGMTWRRTKAGKAYVHIEPNVKSRKKLRESISQQLSPRTLPIEVKTKVHHVNRILRGWAGYFRPWHSRPVLRQLQDWVCERMRGWLWRKHSRSRPKYRYTKDRLFEEYGLYRMVDNLNER